MKAVRAADSVCLVVPCFNEQTRLAIDQVRALAADERVSIVFVDDGSTDGTLELLRSIERETSRVMVIALPHNVGKGEAVRAACSRPQPRPQNRRGSATSMPTWRRPPARSFA
jgi:GT2 family glycosyltransferase